MQSPGRLASTFVPSTPAMTPATNVPWNDCSRSIDPPPVPGPAKPFATITFGVVPPPGPFGKPAGYENPAGERNGVLAVDAVVDDGDLDPFALRTRQP